MDTQATAAQADVPELDLVKQAQAGDTEAFDLGGLPGAVIGVILVLFLYDRMAGGRAASA